MDDGAGARQIAFLYPRGYVDGYLGHLTPMKFVGTLRRPPEPLASNTSSAGCTVPAGTGQCPTPDSAASYSGHRERCDGPKCLKGDFRPVDRTQSDENRRQG